MCFDIRKKKKHMKVENFVKEMKEIYKKIKVILIKITEENEKYMNKNRKKVVEYKVGDKVLISIKDFLI